MARLPRLVIPNQPLHIMHRGNNRQNIFETDDDMSGIKEDLAISLTKSGCQLHAYVIMTNHFHLLVTPIEKDDLKVFMQSLTNRYVRYFNAIHKRTGTIWEGRFKSCLVDSDTYLFTL
jgi:putative transposase